MPCHVFQSCTILSDCIADFIGTIMGSLNGIANVGGIIAPALISGIAGDSVSMFITTELILTMVKELE